MSASDDWPPRLADGSVDSRRALMAMSIAVGHAQAAHDETAAEFRELVDEEARGWGGLEQKYAALASDLALVTEQLSDLGIALYVDENRAARKDAGS